MATLQNLQLRFIYWFLYFFSFSGTKPGPPQYVLFNKVNKWSDARDYCRTSYTDLASVRNEEENQMIKKVSKGKYAWVGVFRDSWVWSDQTYSSFRYWKATKAFSSGITNGCAAFSKNDFGRWQERDCEERHPFLCKCERRPRG
uniref:C-type lectin domain-containing protein n=1 Tax=Sparus aurata TaxID=8175 RepID=A0A671UNJ3_SPAAU